MKYGINLSLALAFTAVVSHSIQTVADPSPSTTKDPLNVLIVGGGSSHDFDRWFHQSDVATLESNRSVWAKYTSDTGSVKELLPYLDVLYLSNNKPFPEQTDRQSIMSYTRQGGGLLLVHAALWYNWNDWPEYNRNLVGGGARSHDRYGEFEVTVTRTDHPLMKNVPTSFRITDELYHFQPEETGVEMEVLAKGSNLETGKTYPVVWISKHPNARIVCTTLGHDGQAHNHPAFQTMIKNAVKWVSQTSIPSVR